MNELKTIIDKMENIIIEMKDTTEKAIYLNDITMSEATENKNKGEKVPYTIFGELPFMILHDYLSKYDRHIEVLEEILDTLKINVQDLPT